MLTQTKISSCIGIFNLCWWQQILPNSTLTFFVLWHDVIYEKYITSKILKRVETDLSQATINIWIEQNSFS
jgi:hypothetical protein